MGRRKRGDKVDGWVVIDKPEGVTSTQVVGAVRRSTNAQKVGHGGTLDPLASGILPIGLGEATKTMPYIVDATKNYEFTVKFGYETETDDREGDVTVSGGRIPEASEIEAVLPQFVGEIDQVPPAYSAIKVDGQRAYDLARAGEDVRLSARTVEIHSLTLEGFDPSEGEARFSVTCGKGTYVRSLGRDIARELGTYGTIIVLRRTRVGPFDLKCAISLENWKSFCHGPPAVEKVLPTVTALDDIPALAVAEEDAHRIRQGQPIFGTLEEVVRATVPERPIVQNGVLVHSGTIVLLAGSPAGPGLLALASVEGSENGITIKPVRVFNL